MNKTKPYKISKQIVFEAFQREKQTKVLLESMMKAWNRLNPT